MSYGLHLAKDTEAGFFTFKDLSFSLKYTLDVSQPFNGWHEYHIPPAPNGFTYFLVNTHQITVLPRSNYAPHGAPSNLFTHYDFSKTSLSLVVRDISLNDSGLLKVFGGGQQISGDQYAESSGLYYIYIRGNL